LGTEAVSDTTDDQLVSQARSGNPAAFGQLVRRHAQIARRMAVLWGAGADADDVVQDAFVKAYAGLPGFRLGGEFRAWLLAIVRNETRNLFRSRGRRSAREELALVADAELTLDPEAAALTSARHAELLRGVRGLGRELREVVACRYLLELSEAETAAALQIPAGTVKSRLHRALTALRQEVVPDG
jgi:RNA polymerase sigma-70 factor, ECF subfamily